jgi:RNase P subunit RPR2
MARIPKGSLVTLRPQMRPFQCFVCGEKLFHSRDVEVRLRATSSARIGLECMGCSYLHIFMDGGKVDLWRPDMGYPT